MADQGSACLQWLIGWFAAKGRPFGGTDAERDADVFELGLLDSLGVVDLIDELERRFGIRFTETELADQRFTTIGGIAQIVSEMLDER